MSGKLRAAVRRFILEFCQLNLEVPILLALIGSLTLAYLAAIAPNATELEMQEALSFALGVFAPLPLSLAGNFLVAKEFFRDTIDFIRTRESLEKIWFYRSSCFLLLSLATVVCIAAAAPLLFGEILPPVMTLTIFVPTLLLFGFTSLVTSLSRNAFLGAGATVTIWLFLYGNHLTLTTRLEVNGIVYYPFLEWAVFKQRLSLLEWAVFKQRLSLMDSLLPNRAVSTLLSIVMLALSFFLYKYNFRYARKPGEL